jgi:hypothetical protein
MVEADQYHLGKMLFSPVNPIGDIIENGEFASWKQSRQYRTHRINAGGSVFEDEDEITHYENRRRSRSALC